MSVNDLLDDAMTEFRTKLTQTPRPEVSGISQPLQIADHTTTQVGSGLRAPAQDTTSLGSTNSNTNLEKNV